MMTTRYEKLPVDIAPENACPECAGAGRVRVRPVGREKPLEISCPFCDGRRVITPEFLEQKKASIDLRGALASRDLTAGEAAQKFSESFRAWLYAVSGNLPVEVIREKQARVEALPPAQQ